MRLGEWVLDQACAQVRRWDWPPRRRRRSPWVNVSPRQLGDRGFVATVAGALDRSGLAPGRLQLEVTQTVLADDAAPRVLRSRRGPGVRLAIDDFGTGYSSLRDRKEATWAVTGRRRSCERAERLTAARVVSARSLTALRGLPFTGLEIDRSFVGATTTGEEDRVIVRAAINLPANLGLVAIAEGVETDQQLDFLTAHGRPLAQGLPMGRPQSPAGIEAGRLSACGPPARG